jgi:predicted acetyltransferase
MVGINATPKIAMIYLPERPVLARSADRLMAAVFETAKHRGQGVSEIALTTYRNRYGYRFRPKLRLGQPTECLSPI